MRCRKQKDDVKTGGVHYSRIGPGENLFTAWTAFRHKGGVNLSQALVWNVGTCRSDGKGETQSGGPMRVRVPMRDTGADQLVVVLKSL